MFFDGFGGFVQLCANVMFEVFNRLPARNGRDIKRLVVLILILGQFKRLSFSLAGTDVIRDRAFFGFIKSIR